MSQGNFTAFQKGNRKLEYKYVQIQAAALWIAGLSWVTTALSIAGLFWATALWIAWLLKATNALWNARLFNAVARSIFVPTTPCHPAHIGHTQSLTSQSFRTFVPSTASFVTLQVASNNAHIIPQFLEHYFRTFLPTSSEVTITFQFEILYFFINLLYAILTVRTLMFPLIAHDCSSKSNMIIYQYNIKLLFTIHREQWNNLF